MNPFERSFKNALERKLLKDITILTHGGNVTMSTSYLIEPTPIRRTRGFWSIPEAGRANAELYRTIAQYVEPISEEEAAAFGVTSESGFAEDNSFTTETFGAESATGQEGTPVHPAFTMAHVRRPRMRRL